MVSTKQTYIAVVDDDEKVCQSIGRLLRAAGLQPITYPSAEAFLADKKHPQFDCLVLDVQLDGMSGIELAQRLKADGGAAPFIFITAFPDESVRRRALKAGAICFLAKPFTGPALIACLETALNGQRDGRA